MTKSDGIRLAFLVALISAFPALWYYNQKINYRSFFQFDRSMLLLGSGEEKTSLSSVNEVINLINDKNVTTELLAKTIATSAFGVLGRVVDTDHGSVEIYEYSEIKKAKNSLKSLNNQETVRYKNMLLLNQSGSEELSKILGELSYEKNN